MTNPTIRTAWRRCAWLCGALLSLALPAAHALDAAQDIVVIAHSDFDQRGMTPAELALIFRRTELVDARGVVLVPVNLPGTHALRVAFSRALFKQSPGDMEAYWNERYFHGVAPPHVVTSVEAMLRFVASTDGAIGYVPACAVDERVRVVARLHLREGAEALRCE